MRNEQLGKIGVDSPGSLFVGVGQRTASDLATEADMIEFGLQGLQACLDIAQALAPGQLRESHTKELIQTGEVPNPVMPPVASHALVEFVFGEEVE